LDTFFSGFSQWGFVSSGDELPYLPEHTGQLRLGLNAERWELWGSYRWQSQMREEPGSGPATLGLHTDSLAIIDLTAMYRVSDQWRVHLMLQNLANESSVVSHRPFGARPNRPRSTVLRIKYTN
jgi:Fe(3+) dicitrate transport protein